MENAFDILVVGGGPAGISSALTAKSRDKSVMVVSNDFRSSLLYRAERVDNYPGFPGISGKQLLETMHEHAASCGVGFTTGRVISAMRSGGGFYVSTGQDFYQCSALIFAVGVVRASAYPGERELLGAGVSYCATCDGMLYRGKSVAVIGLTDEAEQEAQFLRKIGCEVMFFNKNGKYEIHGDGRVEAFSIEDERYPVDGVFILRQTVAMDAVMPELETVQNHIRVGDDMSASAMGVFAAGDCTGGPYQIARATGQGNIAALSAAAYLDRKET